MKSRSLLLLIILPVLTGCQHPLTYAYLMTHPAALEKKVAYCQRGGVSNQDDESCKLIMHAATDFMALLREQQFDPEKFGNKIMQAEDACISAHEKMVQAKRDSLMSDKAKASYLAAKQAYDEQYEQVRILLAVASTSSPE